MSFANCLIGVLVFDILVVLAMCLKPKNHAKIIPFGKSIKAKKHHETNCI